MSHGIESLDASSVQATSAGYSSNSDPTLSFDELIHCSTQFALDMVSEPIVCFSAPMSRLIHANRAACHYLGYSQADLRRKSFFDIAPQANSGPLAEILNSESAGDAADVSLHTVFRDGSGSLIPIRCTVKSFRTSPGRVFVVVGNKIDARSGPTSRYVEAAFRDSLTQLPNRNWLWRQLEREVLTARQYEYQFAVLFIDVDRFKEINDTHGHIAGDQVIQAVTRRLKAIVRPSDDITRYGGDEFVVLMKDVHNEENVRRIAERIGHSVDVAGKCRDSWRVRVTVSIGVAFSGGQCSSAADLIERADRAMYRAKALGRNGQFVIDQWPTDSERNAGVRSGDAAGPMCQVE
jgi:diguanylate cyclase (GGDEF)-like protein/PAS domain S-box-containing protein